MGLGVDRCGSRAEPSEQPMEPLVQHARGHRVAALAKLPRPDRPRAQLPQDPQGPPAAQEIEGDEAPRILELGDVRHAHPAGFEHGTPLECEIVLLRIGLARQRRGPRERKRRDIDHLAADRVDLCGGRVAVRIGGLRTIGRDVARSMEELPELLGRLEQLRFVEWDTHGAWLVVLQVS